MLRVDDGGVPRIDLTKSIGSGTAGTVAQAPDHQQAHESICYLCTKKALH